MKNSIDKFSRELKIVPSPLLEGGYDFDWKGRIHGSLAYFGNEVNIQMIVSKKPGRGYCQKFIKKFKKYCEDQGKELVSSTPISEPWEHICKKYGLKIYQCDVML